MSRLKPKPLPRAFGLFEHTIGAMSYTQRPCTLYKSNP